MKIIGKENRKKMVTKGPLAFILTLYKDIS